MWLWLVWCIVGHFHSDAGCVYRGEDTAKRLHGNGSVTWPRSILGPAVTAYGLWRDGQIVGRLRTPETSPPGPPSYVDVQATHNHCLSRGVCTYLASGRLPLTQHMYVCSTCSLRTCSRYEQKEESCVGTEPVVLLCLSCAIRSQCHLGHTLLPLGRCAMAVCDCGKGQASLRTPLQARLIKQALTRHNTDATASNSSEQICSPPLPAPWKAEKDEEPLWSVSAIIAERKDGKKRQLLTCWLGFPHSADTWSAHSCSPPPQRTAWRQTAQLALSLAASCSVVAGLLPVVSSRCVREPAENFGDGSVDCVREFDNLKRERRTWARLPAEQRAVQPYPIASVWPVDRSHPLYSSSEPAAWSLFPACPSLLTDAAAQYVQPLLQHSEWVQQLQQHEPMKVEDGEA